MFLIMVCTFNMSAQDFKKSSIHSLKIDCSFNVNYVFQLYRDGVNDGVYCETNSGRVSCVCNFRDGKIDCLMRFSDLGELLYVLSDFEETDTYVLNSERNTKTKFSLKCYCCEYYPNGQKKAEGIILGSKDEYASVERDPTEWGEWLYYDSESNVVRTENYSTTFKNNP